MGRWALWLSVTLAVGLTGLLVWRTTALATELAQPLLRERGAYVGSARCRKCHHDNDHSWRQTYHRTMTQRASEASVLGDFSGIALDYMGVRARMGRTRAGGFEVAFDALGTGQRWRAEVVMTVGSHRYQQYLARDGDLLFRLPVAWDVAEEVFIHMNGAFLTPDPVRATPGAPIDNADYNRHVTRWNDNCIFCHNVGPNPGRAADGSFATEVAELGIACEACHGPGQQHAAVNTDPVRRYLLHWGDGRDPTIANPARLAPARAAAVCGRCHGQRISRDIDTVHRTGDAFVPGDDLGRHSRPLFRDSTLNGAQGTFADRFWPDGTARLTAYEYQGVLQSRCATQGDMTCGSCHSMHSSDPRGQVRSDLVGESNDNGLCTQCHGELIEREASHAHSHHDPDGAGGRCVNCHMPKVVYGLVDVHRSHRVDVPAPEVPPSAGQPDACSLCHTDKTRRWLAAQAQRLWPSARAQGRRMGVSDVPEAPGDGQVAASRTTELLFAGDPIERAVAAAALGDDHSPAAGRSGPSRVGVQFAAVGGHGPADRVALLLDTMVADDYPAVRHIAWRSVRRLLARHKPAALAAPVAYRATDERDARQAASSSLASRLPARWSQLPDSDTVAALRARADDVRIEIGE